VMPFLQAINRLCESQQNSLQSMWPSGEAFRVVKPEFAQQMAKHLSKPNERVILSRSFVPCLDASHGIPQVAQDSLLVKILAPKGQATVPWILDMKRSLDNPDLREAVMCQQGGEEVMCLMLRPYTIVETLGYTNHPDPFGGPMTPFLTVRLLAEGTPGAEILNALKVANA
jgi:hypothetical protein